MNANRPASKAIPKRDRSADTFKGYQLSFDRESHAAMMARARKLKMSLSAYIRQLHYNAIAESKKK